LGEIKNQNQRTAGSGYFKNCKELAVFLKEQVTNQWLYSQAHLIFLKFSENPGDISGVGSFGFLRTMVMNPKDAALIIRGGPFLFFLTAQCWS
jgi:hypothetical protein